VQALSRGLRVLEHVHRAGAPVAVRDIADAAGLNVSTAHHLVNTLVWEGYLLRGRDRRLTPGRAFATEGGASPAVSRALGRAAYAADDVAVLCRLEGGEAYIAEAAGVPGAASAGHYPTGARDLAHLLATGRVMLALGTPEQTETALRDTRALARERREIFDEDAIRADLERIRAQRFATLLGDAHGCVAAPVFAPDGSCTASVAIVVAPQRMRRELDRLVAVGRSAGYALTNALAEEAPTA
jgi:DNA-binding IclR family transcriptional regulator